jgi:hypothetical protein
VSGTELPLAETTFPGQKTKNGGSLSERQLVGRQRQGLQRHDLHALSTDIP